MQEGDTMRFYTQPHQYYCGIDLHARTMYACVLDSTGEIVESPEIHTFHQNALGRVKKSRIQRAVRKNVFQRNAVSKQWKIKQLSVPLEEDSQFVNTPIESGRLVVYILLMTPLLLEFGFRVK